MTQDQLYKKGLIQKGLAGDLTQKEMGIQLGRSERRAGQLLADYKKSGDRILVHGNTGREPINKVALAEAEAILRIRFGLNEEPHGYNYAYFRDILEEDHQIVRSDSYVRALLMGAGYKTPERHRVEKEAPVHLMRPRKESFG